MSGSETGGSRSTWAGLDRVVDLAESLAGAWGGRARSSTSPGQERALLRLLGIEGLDRAGRPLAGEVVDRYLAGGPGRLAGGVVMPFAMALVEYDIEPQELALDVASGAIDLALEAELLARTERRAVAELEARRRFDAALERLDANRTARHELQDVLGDAARPWIGTTVVAAGVDDAIAEARQCVRDGFDVLRVEVPEGHELRSLARAASGAEDARQRRPSLAPHPSAGVDELPSAPTGSQRALARLRDVLDEVAAARRAYVRLATAAPALAAPEQAVVAGFERVDLVEADAMAEIVAGRTDPDRSLADHAFAQRLYRRGGVEVLVGAGPLVVAPDLAAGRPSSPATRAGRALALQLLGVLFARGNGLPAGQVIIGALPAWFGEEPDPTTRAVAEVALREVLFPGHPLLFDEPAGVTEQEMLWQMLLPGLLPASTALVFRRPGGGTRAAAVQATRTAAVVASGLAGARGSSGLRGRAAEHAEETLLAARETLERLGDTGWRAIVGTPASQERRVGPEDVAERVDPFDPLGSTLAASA